MVSNHRLPAFNAFLRAPRAFPLPSLSLTNRENREQGFNKVKNLGRGRGEAWRGEGNPSLKRFPSPLQFPTTIYFPNVTRMSLSTNTSACMFLPTACAAAVAS